MSGVCLAPLFPAGTAVVVSFVNRLSNRLPQRIATQRFVILPDLCLLPHHTMCTCGIASVITKDAGSL